MFCSYHPLYTIPAFLKTFRRKLNFTYAAKSAIVPLIITTEQGIEKRHEEGRMQGARNGAAEA